VRLSLYRTALTSPTNGLELYLHIIRDITEEKHAAEDRAALEQRLLRAQKLDAIGRLAGGVAHDFNNLLTLILNYANFLARRLPENSPERDDAGRIVRAGQRAAALTRQLLAFSRREIASPRVIELNAVIGEVTKLLRRSLGEAIDLEAALEPSLWRVFVDPSHVEQLLLNLALNARDAMPRGGRLTVRTANTLVDDAAARRIGLSPGRYVELAVGDTGCGMSPEVLSHIFEPFFTTKERGKGTGLGLSTVYGIVTSAGGTVAVESALQQGTLFRVYLPATDEQPAVEIPEPSRTAPSQGETVLVVDDDEAIRALVVRILGDAGYSVLSAGDIGTALRCAQQHADQMRLLLTDVVLQQGTSGKDLATLLSNVLPHAPVLYMSGYPDDDLVQRGVIGAGLSFIAKPFSEGALLEKVREVLNSARRPDPGSGI
jgi:signal transduction histidine kinase/ActR/RegA family two-component response regulator